MGILIHLWQGFTLQNEDITFENVWDIFSTDAMSVAVSCEIHLGIIYSNTCIVLNLNFPLSR